MTSAPQLARSQEPVAFAAGALERALYDRTIAVIRIPAPRAPIDTPVRALVKSTAIAWRSAAGSSMTAIGRAVEIVARGEDRFGKLRTASDALFAGISEHTHPDVPSMPARLYGGAAFTPRGADRPPWTGFSDARFVLPRFVHERGVLTIAADLRDGDAARSALVKDELAALLATLARPPAKYAVFGMGGRARVVSRRADRAAHRALVAAIGEAIAAGTITKAVASRSLALATDHDLDPWAVLSALRASYPGTWCFGMRFGASATFLGATPERLFEKRGRRVIADALAGSIAAGSVEAADTLASSAKDRREHQPVVEHVRERLAPLSERVEVPREPAIRRLPNVLHLHTRIAATLREGVHAADLLGALHPTPAVCGVPNEAARALIAAGEPHARGWYAGPIGWIDAAGDAEIAIALRCGLVRGASAWLYAGGGIVEGSEADAEWEESELKLRPLIEAIGAA